MNRINILICALIMGTLVGMPVWAFQTGAMPDNDAITKSVYKSTLPIGFALGSTTIYPLDLYQGGALESIPEYQDANLVEDVGAGLFFTGIGIGTLGTIIAVLLTGTILSDQGDDFLRDNFSTISAVGLATSSIGGGLILVGGITWIIGTIQKDEIQRGVYQNQ